MIVFLIYNYLENTIKPNQPKYGTLDNKYANNDASVKGKYRNRNISDAE
jgi:hypothetical protein